MDVGFYHTIVVYGVHTNQFRISVFSMANLKNLANKNNFESQWCMYDVWTTTTTVTVGIQHSYLAGPELKANTA